MRKIQKKQIEQKYVSEVTCDICKKTFKTDISEDIDELQEFHYIDFCGGYGSIFGDETLVQCDICQHCLKEKLGKYLRFNDE